MIDVTCAVIRNDEGLVLAVRRGPDMGNAGKWEFPGGKSKPGEDHEDCIIREIKEELAIDIIISGMLDEVEYDYGDKAIRLIPFICDTLASKLLLAEHDDYRWLKPGKLLSLDMTAADIPVAEQYIAMFGDGDIRADNNEEEFDPGDKINDDYFLSLAPADSSGRSRPDEPAEPEIAKYLGSITSTTEISMVARSAVTDNILLTQLVTLSSSREKRVGFMASWALTKVSDADHSVLLPFVPGIIDALPDVPNESVQRAFMRVVMKTDPGDIPTGYHSRIIEYCMNIMRSEQTAIAPKAYAMEILTRMAVLYPEMTNEVNVSIQLAMNEGSPGIKAMGRKALKKLKTPH